MAEPGSGELGGGVVTIGMASDSERHFLCIRRPKFRFRGRLPFNMAVAALSLAGSQPFR